MVKSKCKELRRAVNIAFINWCSKWLKIYVTIELRGVILLTNIQNLEIKFLYAKL